MALIPVKQIDFGEGVDLSGGSLIISGGLIVSGGVVDFLDATFNEPATGLGVFRKTGSFYATSQDLQVSASFIISGSTTIQGVLQHDEGQGAIQFVYYDASNQQQYIVPISDGQILMYTGSAITASSIIDGGQF